MINTISRFVSRHPWPFVIGFVVVALAFGSRVPSAQVDPDVKSQLPKSFPSLVQLDRIEATFGGVDLVMITLVADDVLAPATLKRMRKLSDGLGKIDNVDRVLSLFELKDIKNEGDRMVVNPAVGVIPTTPAGREALRRDLKNNDMLHGVVVSRDFKASAVVGLLSIEAKDKDTVAAVKKLVAACPGPEEVHIIGMPIIREVLATSIRGDMMRFLPLGMLIMLVFLFISFRQLRGVLLPFFVVVMSVQVSMGLIPLMGWKIQMITIVLPVVLLAVANDYGIHIIARYQEMNTPGNTLTRGELASDVLRELARPIAITGLTTIAGLMCLLTHVIVPASQLGIIASVGIFFAVCASLLFIPGVLALLPKAKPVVTAAASSGNMSLLDRLLRALATAVSGNPKKIIVGFVFICVAVAVGIARIQVDTNTANYFTEDHPIRKASKVADDHFGGSNTFSVAVEGDIKHPAVLRRLDHLERALKALPQVEQVTSITTAIRQMNEVMNNDPAYDRVPGTRAAVAQLLLMYENSGDPEDFDRMVDFGYTRALLTARINTSSTMEQARVIRFVRQHIARANARPLSADPRPPPLPSARKKAAPAKKVEPPAEPGKGSDDDSPFTLVDGEGAEKKDEQKKDEQKKDEQKKEPGAGAGDSDSPFTLVEDERGEKKDKSEVKEKSEKKELAKKTQMPHKKLSAAAEKSGQAPAAGSGKFTMLGGFAVVFNDLVDAVVRGQITSLALSLVLVVLIVAALFKSAMAGLLAGGTLALAMAFLFGLMGLLGFDLNLPTAMLSSIMIGVGVDYTIHFLWRYRAERRTGLEEAEAVMRTLTTTGRGIIINALSVIIGFSVMLISAFVPVRSFGFLVVVSIGACLLGAMVLMPALVMIIKPRFLSTQNEKQ